MTTSIKHYIRELLRIAFPIILGNLGFILIGAGDVLIAGRHSTDTLAAISIAAAITNCIHIFGVGLIASVAPLLSNYRGENKAAKRYFYPTLRFAFILAFIVMLVTLAVIPLIDLLKFEPHLVPMIKQYVFITAFSSFGGYLHVATKDFLQAFEIVMVPNLLTFAGVVLNILLNVIFVFGFGPIPSLGVAGLAIASFAVRYFMGIVLLIYCCRIMRFSNYSEPGYYKQLIKIGLPISAAILVEFVTFNSVAVVMGRVAGVFAAAQNLICTLSTASFMVPFAISNAIAVKVGFANGAENYEDLKKYAKVGVIMCIIFMLCCAVVFAGFPKAIVSLFTPDRELIAICVPIIYILAAFLVFDGLQVALSGICKGIKKTSIVLKANFFAYWIVSIPTGLVLAFKFDMGLIGFWIGLFFSAIILCTIMIFLLKRYFKKVRQGIVM